MLKKFRAIGGGEGQGPHCSFPQMTSLKHYDHLCGNDSDQMQAGENICSRCSIAFHETMTRVQPSHRCLDTNYIHWEENRVPWESGM